MLTHIRVLLSGRLGWREPLQGRAFLGCLDSNIDINRFAQRYTFSQRYFQRTAIRFLAGKQLELALLAVNLDIVNIQKARV